MDENRQTGNLLRTGVLPITPIPDTNIPQAGSHFPVELSVRRPLIRHEKKLPFYIASALVTYAFVIMAMSGAWRFGLQGVALALERTSQSVVRSALVSGENIQETALRASFGATLQSASIIDVLASAFKALWGMLSTFFSSSIELIVHNWKVFLSRGVQQVELSPLDREALKAELREELLRELTGSNISAVPKSRMGVVVTKSTGDQAADIVLTKKIQGVFSDEVTVKVDESGKSGIITPVFLSGKSQEYLYVMVPLDDK